MAKNLIKINDWYKELVFDLRKLAFEGIIKTKHSIGLRILKDELKFGKPEYGSKRIENLAKDLDTSKDDLWACMRFAKKYKNLDAVQQFSWRYIWHKLLPAPKPDKPEIPPLPEGKYNVILADPPWKYKNTGFEMSSNKKYEVLDLEEIKNYKDPQGKLITEIIAENAVLFLWATNPMLREGLEVMEAYGMEYKTNFVWIKNNHTAGFYVLGKSELLLLGVKGNKMLPAKLFKNVIEGENVIHSKKPEIVYDVIEEMYPDGKKVELFHRGIKRDGWECWGKGSD